MYKNPYFIDLIIPCNTPWSLIHQAQHHRQTQHHRKNMSTNHIINVKPSGQFFHKLLIHPGLDAAAIEHWLNPILEQCSNLERALGDKAKVTIFFDELNTAPKIQGLLKTLMHDRIFNNKKVPSCIFFVAAINPPDTDEYYWLDSWSEMVIRIKVIDKIN